MLFSLSLILLSLHSILLNSRELTDCTSTITPSSQDTVLCDNTCNTCTVDCSTQSCIGIHVYSAALTTLINCNRAASCQDTYFYIGNSAQYLPSSFDQTLFERESYDSVNILCLGEVGCSKSTVFVKGSFMNGGLLLANGSTQASDYFKDSALEVTLNENQIFDVKCGFDATNCGGNTRFTCEGGSCLCNGLGKDATRESNDGCNSLNFIINTPLPTPPPVLPPTQRPIGIPTSNPIGPPVPLPTTPPVPTTAIPTPSPTFTTTLKPTSTTKDPTLKPTTQSPSLKPTLIPTNIPSQITLIPSINTNNPSLIPSINPTNIPTLITNIPTIVTIAPTTPLPTITPTLKPSDITSIPTIVPTTATTTTKEPTLNTINPTKVTITPTRMTLNPSNNPINTGITSTTAATVTGQDTTTTIVIPQTSSTNDIKTTNEVTDSITSSTTQIQTTSEGLGADTSYKPGYKAAIIVSTSIAAIALIIVGIYYLFTNQKKKKESDDDVKALDSAIPMTVPWHNNGNANANVNNGNGNQNVNNKNENERRNTNVEVSSTNDFRIVEKEDTREIDDLL